MLEKRFLSTVDFVEIDEKNFSTFSNEYALLLQATGAELDCFFKEYCGFNTDSRKSITEYASFILTDYPDIISQVINIKDTKIQLQPFKNWNTSKPAQSLVWWEAFDKIKHDRYGSYKKANQENVLNTLSALFLLEMKCFKKFAQQSEPDIPYKGSELFSLVGWNTNAIPMKEAIAFIS